MNISALTGRRSATRRRWRSSARDRHLRRGPHDRVDSFTQPVQYTCVVRFKNGRQIAPRMHGVDLEPIELCWVAFKQHDAVQRDAMSEQRAGSLQIEEVNPIHLQVVGERSQQPIGVKCEVGLVGKSQSECACASPRAREPCKTSNCNPGVPAATRSRTARLSFAMAVTTTS